MSEDEAREGLEGRVLVERHLRVEGLGFRVQGLGVRGQGSGFRV